MAVQLKAKRIAAILSCLIYEGIELRGECSVLSVSPELLGVSTSPRGSDGRSLLGGDGSLLEETSGLLAGGGLSSELSVGHLAGADPVDARVVADPCGGD